MMEELYYSTILASYSTVASSQLVFDLTREYACSFLQILYSEICWLHDLINLSLELDSAVECGRWPLDDIAEKCAVYRQKLTLKELLNRKYILYNCIRTVEVTYLTYQSSDVCRNYVSIF